MRCGSRSRPAPDKNSAEDCTSEAGEQKQETESDKGRCSGLALARQGKVFEPAVVIQQPGEEALWDLPWGQAWTAQVPVAQGPGGASAVGSVAADIAAGVAAGMDAAAADTAAHNTVAGGPLKPHADRDRNHQLIESPSYEFAANRARRRSI